MEKNRDGFAGFLDGYRAQNLKSVADSASIHITQINDIMMKLSDQSGYADWGGLLSKVGVIQFSPSSLLVLGETIKAIIRLEQSRQNKLLPNNNFKLLLFHFIEVAKISADNQVIDMAVEITDLLADK